MPDWALHAELKRSGLEPTLAKRAGEGLFGGAGCQLGMDHANVVVNRSDADAPLNRQFGAGGTFGKGGKQLTFAGAKRRWLGNRCC